MCSSSFSRRYPPPKKQPLNSTTKKGARIIGIAGGSGSGKSYIAGAIKAEIGKDCIHLPLDNFYRDLAHLTESERREKNFDIPAAIDWATFLNVVSHLHRGLPVQVPHYDFKTHSRTPRYVLQEPVSTVIVEGLWLFHSVEFQPIYCQMIYVDCPSKLRLERRIKRDTAGRNREAAQIIKQFDQHVRPFEAQWVLPQREAADLIIHSPLAREKISHIASQILA